MRSKKNKKKQKKNQSGGSNIRCGPLKNPSHPYCPSEQPFCSLYEFCGLGPDFQDPLLLGLGSGFKGLYDHNAPHVNSSHDVILVRHAESLANKFRAEYGRHYLGGMALTAAGGSLCPSAGLRNSALSFDGMQNSKNMGIELWNSLRERDLNQIEIWTSPIKRAWQTCLYSLENELGDHLLRNNVKIRFKAILCESGDSCESDGIYYEQIKDDPELKVFENQYPGAIIWDRDDFYNCYDVDGLPHNMEEWAQYVNVSPELKDDPTFVRDWYHFIPWWTTEFRGHENFRNDAGFEVVRARGAATRRAIYSSLKRVIVIFSHCGFIRQLTQHPTCARHFGSPICEGPTNIKKCYILGQNLGDGPGAVNNNMRWIPNN